MTGSMSSFLNNLFLSYISANFAFCAHCIALHSFISLPPSFLSLSLSWESEFLSSAWVLYLSVSSDYSLLSSGSFAAPDDGLA